VQQARKKAQQEIPLKVTGTKMIALYCHWSSVLISFLFYFGKLLLYMESEHDVNI